MIRPLCQPDAVEQLADRVDWIVITELCYIDGDLDTHGGAITTLSSVMSCVAQGLALTVSDCDDADATVYPGASEQVADGVDQDCNAMELCFVDNDGDGEGSQLTTDYLI